MNLDGVLGDGRKRVEPNWITGKERVYEPVRRPPLAAVGLTMLARGTIRMADPDLLGSDPTMGGAC